MWSIPTQGPCAYHAARAGQALACALALGAAGCKPAYPPPPTFHSFQGLPVSGSLADARRVGFVRCLDEATTMRCLRSGVHVQGLGPYEAAVDLKGGDGRGGFDRLTVWHNGDQYELYKVGDALKDAGWTQCFSGEGYKGDQAIYTRPGETVRVTIDLSYWMKRRLRLFREDDPRKPVC